MDENGAPNGKVYVKFGARPNQEIPLEWAEKMLSTWIERNPTQFGKLLAEVVTGAK